MSASEIMEISNRQQRKFAGWAVSVSIILGVAFVLSGGNFAVPLGVGLTIGIVAAVWYYPQVMPMLTLGMACLFELSILPTFNLPRTDQVPIFWNCNTIVQRYVGVNYKDWPMSPFEMLILLSLVSWMVRGIVFQSFKVRVGGLFWPMAAFVACVVVGLGEGLASGGALNYALMEVRALIYMVMAYVMIVNDQIPPHSEARRMLWITAVCVAAKALQAVVRYIFELHGATIPEVGIGSHEESFFFDAFILMLLVLWLAGEEPKLQKVMLALLPVVLWMNLVNQRRAATAAIMIVIPVMMLLAYIGLPARRKMIAGVAVFLAVASVFYFPAFWNKSGTLAQPAHALKSQFTPDARDASSNVYRDEENTNLFLTMETNPLFGFGYGKPFLIIAPMVDLTDIDPLIHYIPHNSQLWIWMRIGTVGYMAFWLMCAAILIAAAQTCRDPRFGSRDRAVAIFVACLLIMQMIFGLLDMQLSNIRNMLFVGLWVGLLANVRMAAPPEPQPAAAASGRAKPMRSRGAWPTIESEVAAGRRGGQ